MEGAAAGRWFRERLWALWLPCCVLLWECLAMGMESTVSPSPAPAVSCATFTKKTCEECVKDTKCLWCHENSTCVDYPVSQLIPPSSVCALSESYWAVCWVNFEAIIITIGVVGGSLLLVILCCCCYCCCRCCSRRCCSRRGFCNLGWCFLILRRVAEEEESFIRDREEKRLQQLQRVFTPTLVGETAS